jgi:hypothetical protein
VHRHHDRNEHTTPNLGKDGRLKAHDLLSTSTLKSGCWE